MATHEFSFAGGDLLRKIGATWFDSYSYYLNYDRKHTNWEKVSTSNMRKSYYDRSKKYHREWLKQVLSMSDVNLSKNTIGLTPFETKRMAQELLSEKI